MSKSEILSKIKDVTSQKSCEKKGVEKADTHIKNDGDLFQNFLTNLQNNKTDVHQCTKEELKEKTKELLATLGSKRVLASSNLPFELDFEGVELLEYNKSSNEFGEELFDCDTSIIQAKLAVSNLGIFCVTSDEQPRLSSLLPQNCIVLIKKESVVSSMNEAYEVFKKEGENPTNIIFIAGPSRTADIELVVVLGVHGSQKVDALIY